MELIDLLISQPSTSSHSVWYSRFSTWNPAAARGWPELWDTFVFPTRCLFSIPSLTLPTSSCTFLLLPPQTTRCFAVQSILCTLKPVIPNLHQPWIRTYSPRQLRMQVYEFVHTQQKDSSVYLVASPSVCVFPIPRLIWLLHPFWS